MSDLENRRDGAGFVLFGLLVGLAAGGAIYALTEYWIDETGEQPLPLSVLLAVVAFAASLLLLAERGARLRAILPATLIAFVLALPTYYMLEAGGAANGDLTPFPQFFWFFLGAPLSGFLLTTLAKASLLDKFPPPYAGVFFHGLTLPLIAGGAKLFAGLALVLLFAWAALLRSMEVDFFHKLFQEPWFILPFLGAVGGLSIAMMRGLQSVLGALRFILLLFARIAMPITAVFSITLVAVLLTKGSEAIFAQWSPGTIMLGLAFAGMLIFNGVYQNGDGGPPPAWLRVATMIALLAFPVYAGFAAWAFWLRVGDYGLTPVRVAGLAMNGLAALYSVVCLAGLVTELNWGGKRWMPLVAPLNTLMACIWVVALIGLATPLANPWEISARSQEARLVAGRVDADAFDYGYLRFSLGAHGARALDRLLALENHPQAAQIRRGVEKARAATSPWDYENGPPRAAEDRAAPIDAPAPGPMDLPLNPGDELAGDAGAAPPPSEPERQPD